MSGTGESTCGNTRCNFYNSQTDAIHSDWQDTRSKPPNAPKLTTMELPFSYVEQGENEIREVMVKIVLCERCVKKLMWKREREKKDKQEASSRRGEGPSQAETELDSHATGSRSREGKNDRDNRRLKSVRKGRNSRSISPRRHPA